MSISAGDMEERSPLLEKCDHLMARLDEFWESEPELKRARDAHRRDEELLKKEASFTNQHVPTHPPKEAVKNENNIFSFPLRGWYLRRKMDESYHIIRSKLTDTDSAINHRTKANNKKHTFKSIEDEKEYRQDILKDQIRVWRNMLPKLIRKFAKIPDYRNPKGLTHKTTVLMMFGLFAFIFKMKSRREMNREMGGACIFESLKKIFPEIDSLPHADTLCRFLEKTDPQEIESIHISLIKDLIRNKKFKKLLINGCIPIAIDGTQKLYRDDLWHDEKWCERQVGLAENEDKQQYIYCLEADMVFKNGLAIPLMTEYLYRHNNQLEQPRGKQDNEITAFERLTQRLKKHFPKLKIIAVMDAMFATHNVIDQLKEFKWDFLIRLPKRKLKKAARFLKMNRPNQQSIPGQTHYRERKQKFYWQNKVPFGFDYEDIHLVACAESYEGVDKKTGKIISEHSEHAWISSIPLSIDNVHELCNLCGRKQYLIENSFNTAKNRGYNYKHAYSYKWNAMIGFHRLMRLAQAINSLSEFSKRLKKYVRDLGVSATLKIIKETLFAPWLPLSWYEEQSKKPGYLRFQME